LGDFEAAEKEGRIAIKLEPLSAIDHADLAWTLVTSSKFEAALAEARTGIELDADSFLSHWLAGISLVGLERYEESISTLNHLAEISNRHQHSLSTLIWAHCANGNPDPARILMNELEERSETEYITGTYMGLSAAYLGDFDAAFNHFEKAFDDRDPLLITLRHMPYVPQSLRNDVRFQKLIDRIGFPQ
jgi:tetratricopeptide (TPR) repeat protein